MMDKPETTKERHLEEARQQGRIQMRDELLEYIEKMGGASRNLQLQLLIIKIEAMT